MAASRAAKMAVKRVVPRVGSTAAAKVVLLVGPKDE